MDIDLQVRPDVACWNAGAIDAYVAREDKRERNLVESTPDLAVTPGRIACSGCTVNLNGHGTFCSAEIIEPVLALKERQPVVSQEPTSPVSVVPKFRLIKPDSRLGEAGC